MVEKDDDPGRCVSRYLSWLSGVTDNSLYPVLIVDYLLRIIGDIRDFEPGGYERMGTLFGITAVLTYLNYRSVPVSRPCLVG
jgi:hypothetical protein